MSKDLWLLKFVNVFFFNHICLVMMMRRTRKMTMKKTSMPRTVARSKSGELCFLDTMTMRIRACPVEKQQQFQLLGVRLCTCAAVANKCRMNTDEWWIGWRLGPPARERADGYWLIAHRNPVCKEKLQNGMAVGKLYTFDHSLLESFFELVGFGWSKECKAPTISTGYARRRWYCCVFLVLLSWCDGLVSQIGCVTWLHRLATMLKWNVRLIGAGWRSFPQGSLSVC